jgi:hypothetical protein
MTPGSIIVANQVIMSSKFLLLSVLSLASFAFPGVAQVIPCIEIRCPTNIAVPCQSSAGSPVAFSVTATNNCGSIVNVSCVPSSGSTFPPGTTIVNCTGSGPNQNGAIQTNRCTFTVTVAGNCPSNCITIKCPSNLVVQCVVPPRATTIGQFQLFGGSVLDTCSTNLTLLSSDSPLTSLCGGTITRVYTVIDGLSNAASCTQTITVSDTIPPVLVGIPGNTNLQCFTLLPPINVTATDNCDTNVIITFTSTTNGVCPTVIVRTWTARDRCTNTTSASQTILVQDTIPPVLFGVPGNTNPDLDSPGSLHEFCFRHAGHHGVGYDSTAYHLSIQLVCAVPQRYPALRHQHCPIPGDGRHCHR